jgi:hypothetical protein
VPGFLFLARSKFILKSAQKQKTRKLRSNFGFMLAMNKSLGTRASVIPPFKIYFDKRLKTKKPKIAQQFWVCACDEQIQGNTR